MRSNIVFADGNTEDLQKFESSKIDIARVGTGATARCNTNLLIEYVSWHTLAIRRRALRLALFYKLVNGLSLSYIINERTCYPLRSQGKFTTATIISRQDCVMAGSITGSM